MASGTETIISFTIAVGNPFSGITLYGMWGQAEAAVHWAENFYSGDDWRLVQVESATGPFGHSVKV